MKIVLIENLIQAQKYVESIDKYVEFTPFIFNYESEKLLEKNNIHYVSVQKYETKGIYKNICLSSQKEVDRLYKNLNISYENIEFWPLFSYELVSTISRSKNYLKLLKKVISNNNPSEVLIFQNSKNDFLKTELISLILPSIYKKKITVEKYDLKNKKFSYKNFLEKILDFFQKIHCKLLMSKMTKKTRNVFIFGGKDYFKDLAQELSNQGFNLFNFSEKTQKSYFVNKKYIPLIKFDGKRKSYDKKIEDRKKSFLKQVNKKSIKKIKITPELEEFLVFFLRNLIKKQAGKIIIKIDQIKNVFERKKVDLVIVNHDYAGISKIFVEIANSNDVPTIFFSHGINSGLTRPVSKSNYIFTYNDLMKKNIEKRTKNSKVLVTGSPKYDRYYKKVLVKKEKIITYGMEVAPEEDRIPGVHLSEKRQKELLILLVKTVKEYFPEYTLIFKLKPYSWNLSSLPKEICEKEGFKNFEILSQVNTMLLIKKSKIFITNSSTIGLEALILKTPLISLSYRDLDPFNYFQDLSFVKIVYDKKGLKKAIQNSLKKNELSSFYKYVNKKGSVKTSINIIKKILNE